MKFNSKYEIGEEVYFYDAEKRKVERGTITAITMYLYRSKVADWTYHIEEKGDRFSLPKSFKEPFVFRDRDEVFKFAYQITENI